MPNENIIRNNGLKESEGFIKHGYQPTGEVKLLEEGYVPTGQSGKGTSENSAPSSPPSGGSAQQDK